MNEHMKAHGKHMLIAGAGVVVLAVVLGAGWRQAVTWGLLLACPVGMLGMMWFMSRHMSGKQQGGTEHGDHAGCHAPAATADRPVDQALSAPGPDRRSAG